VDVALKGDGGKISANHGTAKFTDQGLTPIHGLRISCIIELY
jgi:hypothetical protein